MVDVRNYSVHLSIIFYFYQIFSSPIRTTFLEKLAARFSDTLQSLVELSSCVIYVSWTGTDQREHDLVEVYSIYAIQHCKYCVTIHSTKQKAVKLEYNKFFQIFLATKYYGRCTTHVTSPVQDLLCTNLSTNNLLSIPRINYLFMFPLSSNYIYNWFLRKVPDLVLPDSVLTVGFVAKLPEKQSTTFYTNFHDMLTNSKILLLIYIASRTNIFATEQVSLMNMIFKKLQQSKLSPALFTRLQLDKYSILVSKVNAFPEFTKSVTRISDSGKSLHLPGTKLYGSCAMTLLTANYREVYNYRTVTRTESCIKHMYNDFANRSFNFSNTFVNYEEASRHTGTDPLPFVTEFQGYRFAVILQLSDHSAFRKRHILALMASPFNKITWIVFIAVGLKIVVVMKYAEGLHYTDTLLWLMTQILENGTGYLNKALNRKTICLLCGWMLGGIILRNVYTGYISTSLIKVPDPENIPESLHQLLDNGVNKYSNIIMSTVDIKSLHYHVRSANDSKNRLVVKIENSFERFKFYMRYYFLNLSLIVQNISAGLPIRCGAVGSVTIFRNCPTKYRFAMVYKIALYDFFSSKLAIPVIKLISRRQIYENLNHPVELSEPVVWAFQKKSLFDDRFKMFVAMLQESGIYKKLDEGLNIIWQIQKFKSGLRYDSTLNYINIYTYSSLVVTSREVQLKKLDQPNVYIMFEDLREVLCIYIYLILVGACALASETLIQILKSKCQLIPSKYTIRIKISSKTTQ